MMLKNSLRSLGIFAFVLHLAFAVFPTDYATGNKDRSQGRAAVSKEALERRYLATIGELVERGKFTQALDFLATKDLAPAKSAAIRQTITGQLFRQRIREIDQLLFSGDLAEAQARIDPLLAYMPTHKDLLKRKRALTEFLAQRETAVLYQGPVRHVMTHSLIFDPSLAFDGEYTEAGYHMWMLTVDEFRVILDELYARGFILIDIHNLLEIAEGGQIRPRDLYLPPGKTPIVFSIDDVSYYEYMNNDGFAIRLDIHAETLDVINIVRSPEGDEIESWAADVFPILDEFIWEYPDFSYQGAKGILALTGYEGVLGYRTNDLVSPAYPATAEKARSVADRMKELGWQFGSHSYTHDLPFQDASITFAHFKEDTDQWEAEVAPIVGRTDIYISPFGYRLPDQDERYRYLVENAGFKVFCPISALEYLDFRADNMVMDRINFDGFMMTENRSFLTDFFDVDRVYDWANRPSG